MPRARHASIAGAIASILLAAEQTMFAGVRVEAGDRNPRRAMPNSGSSRAVSAMVRSIDDCVRVRGTSASAMCTVASTTRSTSE